METLSRTPTVDAVRADGVGNGQGASDGAADGAVAEAVGVPGVAEVASGVADEAEAVETLTEANEAKAASEAAPAVANEVPAVAQVVTEPEHGAAEPDVEALIEAAEHRGFERGLSAAGGRGGGQAPSLWQAPPAPVKGVDEEETRQLSFLSYIRPSVWD